MMEVLRQIKILKKKMMPFLKQAKLFDKNYAYSKTGQIDLQKWWDPKIVQIGQEKVVGVLRQ